MGVIFISHPTLKCMPKGQPEPKLSTHASVMINTSEDFIVALNRENAQVGSVATD